MNILFYLTPKSEVAYLYDDYTMRQALEKMEYHKYAAIPILNRSGEYVGTITEGDLLYTIKNEHTMNMAEVEYIPLMKISRRMDNQPVSVGCNMEDLIHTAMRQNFVPVIDDKKRFIGIVKRSDIIEYCYQEIEKAHELVNKG